jgi:hypothetical protein
MDKQLILHWPNGNCKRKCSFAGGVRHGRDLMWNEAGILVDEGSYEFGKPVQFHRRYNKKGALVEEIEYLDADRFNLRSWDEKGGLCVEAIWIDATTYREKVWDRFQNVWIEKKGIWNGKKLVYL